MTFLIDEAKNWSKVSLRPEFDKRAIVWDVVNSEIHKHSENGGI